MLEISFEINGKKVHQNKISEELERSIVKNIVEQLSKKVGYVVCPEHGNYAKITASGDSISHLDLRVSGCCQKIVDKVKSILK